MLVVVAATLSSASSFAANTFTVTSTADNGSAHTLRWAITQANNTPNSGGSDVIDLSGVSGQTISVASSPLPAIMGEPVQIDGSNAVIDGTGITGPGLDLGAGSGGSYIHDLVIQNFTGDGLDVESNDNAVHNITSQKNTGYGVYVIGASSNVLDGSDILDNTEGGVRISATGSGNSVNQATFNTIGGTSLNTIAGNGNHQVYLDSFSANPLDTFANEITGNAIGVHGPGNSNDGISVFGAGTQIGTPALPNTIGGAGGPAIVIRAQSTGNTISGNSLTVSPSPQIVFEDANTSNDGQAPPTITGVQANDISYTAPSAPPSDSFTLEFFSSGAGDCGQAGRYLGAVQDVASGGSGTFTVPGTGIPANEPLITATATDQANGDTSTLSDTFGSCASGSADLAVTLSHQGTSTLAGTTATFTGTVSNAGPDATDALVQVTMPSQLTNLSGTLDANACTVDGSNAHVLDCSISNLAGDGSPASFTVQGDIPAGLAPSTTLEVDAVASPTSVGVTDPNGTDNSTSTSIVSTAAADLNLTDQATPSTSTDWPAGSAVAGGTIDYALTIDNNTGPSDNRGFVVQDVLPHGATLASASSTDCQVTTPATGPNGDTVQCTNAGLAFGAHVTYTLHVNVASSEPATASYSDQATLGSQSPADPSSSNDQAHATVPLVTRADISLSDQASPSASPGVNSTDAVAGGSVQYTLTVHNTGPSDNTGFTVQDVLPHGASLTSSNPAGCTSTPGDSSHGPTVTCVETGVQAGHDSIIKINAAISPSEPANASWQDSSSITHTSTTDPDSTDYTAGTTLNLVTRADLNLTDQATPSTSTDWPAGSAVAGGTIDYALTIDNNTGPSDNRGFVVQDVLPHGATLASASSTDCQVTTPATGPNGDTVQCTNAGLAFGAHVTYTLHVNVASSEPATASYSDQATLGSQSPADPSSSNDQAHATVPLVTRADLAVTDNAVPSTSPTHVWPDGDAVAGGTVQYTVSVANNGPSDNAGFTLQDVLPHGASVPTAPAGCTVTPGGTSTHGDTVLCPVSGLTAGGNTAQTSFVINASISPSEPDNATWHDNVSILSNATTDPHLANNSPSASLVLVTRADLRATSISAVQDQTPHIFANTTAGQNGVTVTFQFTNDGPSDGQSTNVTDTFPAGLIPQKYCIQQDALTCPLPQNNNYPVDNILSLHGPLPAGHGAVVVIKAVADPSFRAQDSNHIGLLTLTDTATANTSTTDPNHANDASTSGNILVSTVPAPPSLTLVTPGSGQIGVQWNPTPPLQSGGETISGYNIYANPCPTSTPPNNPPSCKVRSVSSTPNAMTNGTADFSYVVPGFSNGIQYSITVDAQSAVGEGNVSNALTATPNAVAQTIVIPTTGTAALDTGFSGGAVGNCDPSTVKNCDVVSKYSLTDTANIGSLVNLDTEALAPATSSSLFSSALGPTPAASQALCQKIDVSPGTFGVVGSNPNLGKLVQGDCSGNVAVRSTYPTVSATKLHLEYDQYDASISSGAEGAPCLAVYTNSDGTVKYSDVYDKAFKFTPPTGTPIEPVCSNPNYPLNLTSTTNTSHPAIPGTNLCADGFHWTAKYPCAYIYYEAVQVNGYDLSFVNSSGQGRPKACTPTGSSTDMCGKPFVIGSSVQGGLKTRVPYNTGSITPIVRPWCQGTSPNFVNIPCVLKFLWLNGNTGNGNNDMQVQTYMPELDPIKGTTG